MCQSQKISTLYVAVEDTSQTLQCIYRLRRVDKGQRRPASAARSCSNFLSFFWPNVRSGINNKRSKECRKTREEQEQREAVERSSLPWLQQHNVFGGTEDFDERVAPKSACLLSEARTAPSREYRVSASLFLSLRFILAAQVRYPYLRSWTKLSSRSYSPWQYLVLSKGPCTPPYSSGSMLGGRYW